MSWECLRAEDSRGITGVLTPALSLLCRGVAVVYIPSPRSMALKVRLAQDDVKSLIFTTTTTDGLENLHLHGRI